MRSHGLLNALTCHGDDNASSGKRVMSSALQPVVQRPSLRHIASTSHTARCLLCFVEL
jgi:hypothetical protein